MEETRAEKFEREEREKYLDEAVSVYNFCRKIRLNKERSLEIAKLSFTLEDCRKIYKKCETRKEFYKKMIKLREKIERNRTKSLNEDYD